MIEPSPTAPEGLVEHVQDYIPEDFLPSDVILCRNVAPLVTFAFALIKRNVGVRVLGREIGAGLIQLIEKLKPSDLHDLDAKVEAWRSREEARCYRKGNPAGADGINDKASCIQCFIDEEMNLDGTVAQVKDRIASLFKDGINGVLTLATVHKSKGLEWDRVWLLDRDLIPSKYATQPWQLRQERNLMYVAVTRAKLELRFIHSGAWRKPKAPDVVKPLSEAQRRRELLADL